MRHRIFLVALLLFFTVKPVFAATSSSLTVVPSLAQIDLATDKPEAVLTYKNSGSVALNISFSTQDFTAFEDGYKIKYLTENDAKNYRYSLSSWISFEQKSIRINPHEEKQVKLFIDSTRVTKGAHYASILAQIDQDDNGQKIAVRGILSSLLFVRASTGQEIESGIIVNLRAVQNFIEFPASFVLRFENTGNVDVVPYGILQITGPFGKRVAKAILNENSSMVLPESIRRLDLTVTKEQSFFPPGIYTAKLSMHFGKTGKILETTVNFFSQGSIDFTVIGIIFAATLAAFLLIRWWRKK